MGADVNKIGGMDFHLLIPIIRADPGGRDNGGIFQLGMPGEN
jgi:hypothetical protein